jgi:hypothetical protein
MHGYNYNKNLPKAFIVLVYKYIRVPMLDLLVYNCRNFSVIYLLKLICYPQLQDLLLSVKGDNTVLTSTGVSSSIAQLCVDRSTAS